MIWRAVSSDPEEPAPDIVSRIQPSSVFVPGGLQTCPLNPLLELLAGNDCAQTHQDAFQTLGLMGLTGMVHMVRRGDDSGSNHALHHMADLTDDLLQPDEESQQTKRVQAPFVFGWECKY